MPATSIHDTIQVGPVTVRYHLDAAQTNGYFTMFEFSVPSKARVPVPHSHEAFDETVYGLAGVTTWTLDGKPIAVSPGESLFIRRGVVHQFENWGEAEARSLSVITPGLLGPAYFQEIATVLNAPGPPNIPAIMAVMQRHGLRPAPPAA